MRLLLDEMYPAAVAQRLRRRNHQVTAVTERPELRALDDQAVFAAAQEQHRALVTENVADLVSLADAAEQRGGSHHGLILVSPARFPRGIQHTVGRLVRALDALLPDHPGQEPASLRDWL